MAETLTESFCESCGTRYEFAAPSRLSPLGKTRGLFGGIKNYLTGGEGLGDAIDDAMRSEEEALAAAQLDAFHSTFSFCISCRQYTCNACWNTDAGRCRNCAPVAGLTGLATGAMAAAASPVDVGAPGAGVAPLTAGEAWPIGDLGGEAAAIGEPEMAWPAADDLPGVPTEEPATWAGAAVPDETPLPAASDAYAFEPERLGADLYEREPAVAEDVEPEWLTPEAVEPEREPAAASLPESPEPPRISIWDDELEPVAEEAPPEPEPVAAEAPPFTEISPVSETLVRFPAPPSQPVAPEPLAEPIAPTPIAPRPVPRRPEPEVAQPAAAAAGDAEMAARRAKLDLLGLGDPGEGPVTQRPAVLPYRSGGAPVHQIELAQRASLAGTLWAASVREVTGTASHVGVQACGECGLSLSATARFCRRCGTRQARSA